MLNRRVLAKLYQHVQAAETLAYELERQAEGTEDEPAIEHVLEGLGKANEHVDYYLNGSGAKRTA